MFKPILQRKKNLVLTNELPQRLTSYMFLVGHIQLHFRRFNPKHFSNLPSMKFSMQTNMKKNLIKYLLTRGSSSLLATATK